MWRTAGATLLPTIEPVRRVALLVLLLAAAACSDPVKANASGAEIYLQLCARCHGADLEGGLGPPLGPGSSSADRPDEFLVTTIARGRGRMPSFSSTLDPDQIDRLVSYLRERQAG